MAGALALREEGLKAGTRPASRWLQGHLAPATGTYRGDLQTKPGSSQQYLAGG